MSPPVRRPGVREMLCVKSFIVFFLWFFPGVVSVPRCWDVNWPGSAPGGEAAFEPDHRGIDAQAEQGDGEDAGVHLGDAEALLR